MGEYMGDNRRTWVLTQEEPVFGRTEKGYGQDDRQGQLQDEEYHGDCGHKDIGSAKESASGTNSGTGITFSTFGPLEISSLQVLALEDCYNETTLPFETTLTSQLQRMVKKFTGLRELLIVYDVVAMTDRTIDCADGHPLEIHTEIPSELKHPSVMIDPLPKDEDAEAHGFKLWEVKKCKPVYGWRRCPGGVSFSDLDLSLEDDMSDEENFGLYGPWGGPPPPLAMGLARMFGGPLDSDEEDDMFGYGVDFDEDDEEDDDDDEEDDEEDQDDAASIDSVD